jgi:hypothetical protein
MDISIVLKPFWGGVTVARNNPFMQTQISKSEVRARSQLKSRFDSRIGSLLLKFPQLRPELKVINTITQIAIPSGLFFFNHYHTASIVALFMECDSHLKHVLAAC